MYLPPLPIVLWLVLLSPAVHQALAFVNMLMMVLSQGFSCLDSAHVQAQFC